MTVWDELSTAALLGTARRPVDVSAVPGALGEAVRQLPPADPAERLLDAAALVAPHRRAGTRPPATLAQLPRPAGADTLPPVRPAAAARLAGLLTEPRSPADTALLHEWLATAAAHGRRVPAEALPALLDAALRQRDLGPLVVPVLGERGAWLARFRPDWHRLVTAAAGTATAPADREWWRTGDAAQRRQLLAALRRTDPDAARELLTGSWATESGEDREAFVDLLGTGLTAADEPLLEAALDDRRSRVRERAAELLHRLPDSGYADRMTDRVAAVVHLERRLLRTRLTVTLPAAGDDRTLARDGVGGPPPRGTGAQAWRVQQLVTALPLPRWASLTGLTPAELLQVPVDDGWRDVLIAGWAEAAQRQQDQDWARALLAAGEGRAVRAELVAVLPPAERADVVAASLADAAGLLGQRRSGLLATVPGPWPEGLTRAVLTWLARPAARPEEWLVREQLALVAGRLPPGTADAVRALAAGHPDGSPWQTALLRVADTLTVRTQLHEELR